MSCLSGSRLMHWMAVVFVALLVCAPAMAQVVVSTNFEGRPNGRLGSSRQWNHADGEHQPGQHRYSEPADHRSNGDFWRPKY